MPLRALHTVSILSRASPVLLEKQGAAVTIEELLAAHAKASVDLPVDVRQFQGDIGAAHEVVMARTYVSRERLAQLRDALRGKNTTYLDGASRIELAAMTRCSWGLLCIQVLCGADARTENNIRAVLRDLHDSLRKREAP